VSIRGARADQTIERHRASTSYAGVELPITDSGWLASATARYRKFFASNKEWDYFEFSAQLHHERGFSVNVDYAPDYYAHNTRALVTEISQYVQISPQFYAIAAFGNASFKQSARQRRAGQQRASDYQFGRMAGGWLFGRSSVELAYAWHNLDSSQRFRDAVQNNGLRLNLHHRWR